MVRQATRSLTNPRWVLRYALEQPKRALKILLGTVLLCALVTASVAVDAIPVWIAGYALTGLLFALGYREGKRLLLIREATEDDAGTLTPGPTKVHGTVTTTEVGTTTSYKDNVDCVAYTYREERKKSGNEGHTSTTTKSESLPFYIEDGTGAALVDPTDAHLELKTDSRRGGRRSQTESYLEPGDSVAVYGECVRPRTTGQDTTDASATGQVTTETTGQASGTGTTPQQNPILSAILPEGIAHPGELDDEQLPDPEEVPPEQRAQYRQMLDRLDAADHATSDGSTTTHDEHQRTDQQTETTAGGRSSPSPDQGQSTAGQRQAITEYEAPSATDFVTSMAEGATRIRREHDHVLAGENLVLARGPEYNTAIVTDKHGFRVYARQAFTTLLYVVFGLGAAAASTGLLVGVWGPL